MGGGEIVIRPAEQASFAAGENTIVGNTVLYGATSGALFVAGRAGGALCCAEQRRPRLWSRGSVTTAAST